jgi:hypothetical protein
VFQCRLDTSDEFTRLRGHGFGGVDPVGDLDPENLLWSVISTRRPVLSRGPR